MHKIKLTALFAFLTIFSMFYLLPAFVGNNIVSALSAPLNTALPTVSGTTSTGYTLTASNGSWSNSPTSYTYQWQDCLGVISGSGSNCANIVSATSSTYQIQSSDLNHYLQVKVTASNSGGSNTAISNATAQITSPTCTPPTTPTGLTETAHSYATISFYWTPSTADTGCTIAGYDVYQNGVKVGTVNSGTSYVANGLTAGNSYAFSVVAFDNTGQTSTASNATSFSTTTDNQAPTVPNGLSLTLNGPSEIDLSWLASTDLPNPGGVGVESYSIFGCNGAACTINTATPLGDTLASSSSPSSYTFADTKVNDASSLNYSFDVNAIDKVGNASSESQPISINSLSCTTAGSQTDCSIPSASNYASDNVIVAGNETLSNDSTVCNTTVSSGGMLRGNGSIGSANNPCDLSVNSGGIVSPGHSPGCLDVYGNYSSSGQYNAEIQSPGVTPCTDYDQIVVHGDINLNNTKLNVSLLSGFSPAPGKTFTIIDNLGSNAISGTFSKLPEGSTFTIGSTVFKISYKGGNGKSVVLTVETVPSTPDTGFGLAKTNTLLPVMGTTIAGAGALIIASRKYYSKPSRK